MKYVIFEKSRTFGAKDLMPRKKRFLTTLADGRKIEVDALHPVEAIQKVRKEYGITVQKVVNLEKVLKKSKQVQVSPHQRKGRYVKGHIRLDPREKLGEPFKSRKNKKKMKQDYDAYLEARRNAKVDAEGNRHWEFGGVQYSDIPKSDPKKVEETKKVEEPKKEKEREVSEIFKEKKGPQSIKRGLLEGLYQGIAEGMEEALKDVKGVDEKILRDAVSEVKSNVLDHLKGALKQVEEIATERSEPRIVFGGKEVSPPKGYAKEYFERKKELIKSVVEERVVNYFKNNPSPPDKKVHALADRIGIKHDKLESIIYSILGDIISHGKGVKANAKELKMGIKIEMEHTKHPIIARYIALAHLKEMPDYYTRLIRMEKEAKSGNKG